MEIHRAEFVKSSQRTDECPPPDRPEFAFIGRSNVGKSSLINMLTGVKGLAKTSGTPGKTQLINHFLVTPKEPFKPWYLVDLPGYGYAKVSKASRNQFLKFIYAYLESRTNLLCTFLLIDMRHPLLEKDHQFMQWLARKQLPFCLVFTKRDKLTPAAAKKILAQYNAALLEHWEFLPDELVTSAEKKLGRAELLGYMGQVMDDSEMTR